MADPTKAQYALRFIAGKYKGGEFPLKPSRDVIVGRNSEYDMVLHEDMVSRRHAKIGTHNGQIILTDLKSTNGSFVNGEKVSVSRLKVGDRVLIGTSMMQLVEMDTAGAGLSMQETPAGGVLEPSAATKISQLGGKPTASVRPPPESNVVSEISQTTSAHQAINPPINAADIATITDAPAAQLRPLGDGMPPDMTESMRGRFPDDDMQVPDLVDFFNSNRKSGVLILVSPGRGEGRVYLREGHLYFAAIDRKADATSTDTGSNQATPAPLKCFYRLLTWPEGEFRFYTTASLPSFDNEIQDETRNLLLEGVRQWDELKKFEGHLPSVDQNLELKKPLIPRLSDLSAEALDTLQIAMNERGVQDILDRSDATDLETFQDLLYLLQNGYVAVV